jgi:hypothetical protein
VSFLQFSGCATDRLAAVVAVIVDRDDIDTG